jgi:predicted MPP superfamily phosphohydrolase
MTSQNELKHFNFEEINLDPGNFADELKGLRFIQISDLYLKKNIEHNFLENFVKKINSLDLDFVFFTGDILGDLKTEVPKHFRAFKLLIPKAYYVSGSSNFLHNIKSLKKEMSANGIKCLDNSISKLKINHTDLQIIGLSAKKGLNKTDTRPINELLSKLKEETSTILLCHSAQDIKLTKKYRIDIQLSSEIPQRKKYIFKKFKDSNNEFHLKGLYVYGRTLLYVASFIGYIKNEPKVIRPKQIPIFTII